MGHKINPDIYRLGVSKTWTFQLRTNKNFIKNLFLFKFLRNLFVNYTIPLFDFKKTRNQKMNDKLILRGEEQLVLSPFVKNNILFSHVYFGLVKDKLFLESFFIDVAFKQQKKQTENLKRKHYYDLIEFKPWNSFYYKKVHLRDLNEKNFKTISHNKRLFSNRLFKFFSKRSRTFSIKPLKLISKNFFYLFKNTGKRYNKRLHRYLAKNFLISYKKVYKKKKET